MFTVFIQRDPEYELETFHSKTFPSSALPALVTSSVVADMLRFFILFSHICLSSYVLHIPRDCVTEFAKTSFDVDSSWGRFINKVAVRYDVHPKIEKRETMFGSPEVLEVLNSFRTPFSIPIVRMEQVGF